MTTSRRPWLWLPVIAMGFGVCLGGAWFLYRSFWIGPEDQAQSAKVEVLVARKHIPFSTLVNEPQLFFKKEKIDADKRPAKALTSFEQVKSWYLVKEFRAGEILGESDLVDGFDRMPGTIPVKLKLEWNGFPAPGMWGTLIHTIHQNEDIRAKVLVDRILVLAQKDEWKEKMRWSIVTVALKSEDLAKVNKAKDQGALDLVLFPVDE